MNIVRRINYSAALLLLALTAAGCGNKGDLYRDSEASAASAVDSSVVAAAPLQAQAR